MTEGRVMQIVLSLLAFVALVSIVVASTTVATIDDHAPGFDDVDTESTLAAQAMLASVATATQETFAFVISGDEIERDDARRQLEVFDAEYERFVAAGADGRSGDESALLERLTTFHDEFADTTEQIYAEVERTGDISDEVFLRYERHVDSLTSLLDELIVAKQAETREALEAGVDLERRANDRVLFQGYLIAALAVLFGAIVVVLFRLLERAHNRARQELNIHLQALEATTIGIVIGSTADNHPVVYVNAAFEHMTGFERDEVVGNSLDLLSGSRSDPDIITEIYAAISAGEASNVVITNYAKDGTPIQNAVHISPIRDRSGRVTHWVQAMEDVTDRLRLERRVRQSEKMDAIGQLAGGIAHDFNNYLMVIKAAIEVIRLDPAADVDHWLGQIDEAGSRSAALTAQLMTFSRADMLDVTTVDLNEVVTDMVPLLRSTIREDIAIAIELSDESCLVTGDRSQLDQIITNIVINARDAMPDGGSISIATSRTTLSDEDVRGEPHVAAGGYAVLEVADTGSGIDNTIAPDIFEPFATTKEGGFGAGLGLATVYRIVSNAAGMITVDSTPGDGTRFRVHLPLADVDTRPAGPSITDDHRVAIDGPVLLVEDDETVRRAVRSMLQALGFAVVEAADGVDALDVLSAHEDVRLIVSDMTMPRMGGVELAQCARAVRPGIEVLLISGYSQERPDDAATSVLAKPFTLAELTEQLVELAALADPPPRTTP